jgi:hypothetical protein
MTIKRIVLALVATTFILVFSAIMAVAIAIRMTSGRAGHELGVHFGRADRVAASLPEDLGPFAL